MVTPALPPPTTTTPFTIKHNFHSKTKQLSFNTSQNNTNSTASWTSSIAHNCKNNNLQKALLQFTQMRLSEIEPNHITLVTILSGCAHFPKDGILIGPSIHGYATKLGLVFNNVMVGTSLIDMYAKIGQLRCARLCFDYMGFKNKVSWNTLINGYMRNGKFESAVKVFDEMPERDAVSWTVLIDGFVKKGKFEEALVWFQEMLVFGMEPDFVTMVSVLSAVANLGTLGLGLWLHCYVMKRDFRGNIRVNNSLIDMYCRCGCVELACQVFEKMDKRSLVTWNSIIVGLAVNAHAEEALKYFRSMRVDGLEPDSVSFTGALTACSHAGLVNEGLELFKSMKEIYKINPRMEHYGCMVDLYSRAGKLKEALLVIQNMPIKPNEVIFGSLLAACRNCGDVDLAERIMDYIYNLESGGDSNYDVMLSNIYAASGSWRGASKLRKKMKARGVQKKPGISSVEVNGAIHEFVAGDKSHAEAETIYTMLDVLSHNLRITHHASENCFWELSEDFCKDTIDIKYSVQLGLRLVKILRCDTSQPGDLQSLFYPAANLSFSDLNGTTLLLLTPLLIS